MGEKTLVLEGLPDDLDFVRPKLQLYFKSKRRSGGEVLRIQDHPEDTRKALLIYLDDRDVQNVLVRLTHPLDFGDLGMVHLNVKLKADGIVQARRVKPPVPPKHQWNRVPATASQAVPEGCKYLSETPAERWDPHRFILTGFDETCKCGLITLYISSCSQNAEHTWELLDEDRIVVTFKGNTDVHNFLTKCSTKKVEGMRIKASRLELTDSILVKGNMSQVKEETLIGYFSNKRRSRGGDVKSLLWIISQTSVVITFKDFHAAYQVVEQRHHLCGEDLTVRLFFSRLQKALTGEKSTLYQKQTNFNIPVDVNIFSFIENNEECKKDLQSQLQMVHGSVLLDETTFPRKLVVEMTVDKESLAALQIGPTWENNARKVTQSFLAKYSAAEVAVEPNEWKIIESTCLKLSTPEADIFYKQTDFKIIIVGLTEVVKVHLEKIKNLVKGAATNLVNRKSSASVIQRSSSGKIPLKSVREMEFIESLILSDIPAIKNLGIYLEYTCDTQGTPYLNVTAAENKLQDALLLIQVHLSSIVMETLTYSKAGEAKVIEKNEGNMKAKAKVWNCKLYFEHLSNCNQTRSFTHKIGSSVTFTIAEGELHQYIADALICPLTTDLSFDNAPAQEFLEAGGSQIQEVCNNLQKENQTLEPGNVILSNPGNLCAKTLIYTVLPKSCKYLSSHYLKSAIVQSLCEAERRNSASIAMPVLGSGKFGFSIKESCSAIREAILNFIAEHQNTPRNVKNIFVVDADWKVVEEFDILLAELGFPSVTTTSTSTSPSQLTNHDLKPKLQSNLSVTVQGVQVSLKKGDITKETVDVIVNSNNWDLNLHTGVSGAIFKAAGKSIVHEYTNQVPRPGDIFLTGSGDLSCKYIAQMFGPSHAADISASIEKLLDLCERERAATVAIPAIGTGRGGISAYESIRAIFTGLENHLKQWNSPCLKEIIVIAFDQIILNTFLDYFKEKNEKHSHTGVSSQDNQVKIEGVRVEIKKGNITNERVQAIVNTTNKNMKLKTGVSGAILKTAGPSVEEECQKLGPLLGNVVAVTHAGTLQCDFIIHMIGPHSAAEARLRVMKVLERCEQMKITTVSFPAIGTGRGGLKGVEVMDAMLHAFEDHFSQRSCTAVELICVVTDRDEVLQEFLQSLKVWKINMQESWDDDEDQVEEESRFPEETELGASSYFHRHAAQLLWDPDRGFSVDKLDPEMKGFFYRCGISEAELKDKNTSKVIFDFIEKEGGVEGVKEQLRKEACMKNQKKNVKKKRKKKSNSIGTACNFWLTGFDVDNLDPDLKELFDMCGINEKHLRDMETLKVINDFIEKRGGVEAVKEQFRREVPKPTQACSSPAQHPLQLSSETAAVSFPVMTVEVYGTSPDGPAKVKNLLDELISEECTSKDIQSSYLSNLQEAEKEAIIALSRNNQVHILVASSDRLTVSGKRDDVLDTVLNISTFMQAAKEREVRESEEKRLRETLCWEVADGETWVPLDSHMSYELELAFHKKEQTFTYEKEGEVYTVDFKELTQENSKRKSCRIKRTLIGDSDTAIIQPPPTWTKMEAQDLEIIPLTPTLEEYQKIETAFLSSSLHASAAPVQVVQICRIQNKGQWQRYSVLKQEVDKKYPNQSNERFLYHGTTKEISQKINKNGFNRSFCGRNAVAHGNGTYFAKEAWYSCKDQYSNPDESGLKYIYRARVVTGLPCKSQRGMKEPDPLDPNNPRAGLHDCAVDDLQNPFIFLVFCDAGAYPDYLITFINT